MVEIEREAPRDRGEGPGFTSIRAARASEIAEGGCKLVTHGHSRITIFRVEGALYAIDDHCPHEGWSLASGTLDGSVLTCAGHDWQVDVRTGACLTMRRYRVRRFEVIVQGEDVWLRVPASRDGDPGVPPGVPR